MQFHKLSPRRSTAAPHTCGDLDVGEVRTVKFSDAQPKEKGADQNCNCQPYQWSDDKSFNGKRHALFYQFLCSQCVRSQSDITEDRGRIGQRIQVNDRQEKAGGVAGNGRQKQTDGAERHSGNQHYRSQKQNLQDIHPQSKHNAADHSNDALQRGDDCPRQNVPHGNLSVIEKGGKAEKVLLPFLPYIF